MISESKKILAISVVVSVILSSVAGGAVGYYAGWLAKASGGPSSKQAITPISDESAVVKAVERVSPAVVSIIITKDLPKIDQTNPLFNDPFFRQFFGDQFGQLAPQPQNGGGTQQQEIGGGTGFIVSPDGYIVTNKHVVADPAADYTVLLAKDKKYTAKVLARDPINDLAILKIDAKNLPTVELGDSSNLKAGQSVIAIGNALGEFRNTVSVGVISGLARSITAGDAGSGSSEDLAGVIQTDASINPGNSGGPLLNINGQVIGVNTAVAQSAQGIGFSLPINELKGSIDNVKKNGRLIRPWLGLRYQLITPDYAKQSKLPVDYGALIIRGQQPTDLAVIPGSPADKAGLQENDIILELNGQKIDENNPLSKALANFQVGDTVKLKVLHRGKGEDLSIKLEEAKQQQNN